MTDVLHAKTVQLQNCRILFDTNIWMLIFDYNAQSLKHKTAVYSDAYRALLQNDNTIIVNDYVLGEFCNRCTRIQYDIEKAGSGDPTHFPEYKAYRQTANFRQTMEGVRDTCLSIVEDHEYLCMSQAHYDVNDVLERFCKGEQDFSDILIADFCKKEELYLMTDDKDFSGCGLKLITANKRYFNEWRVR